MAKLWNDLPISLRVCENYKAFKVKLKSHLFKHSYEEKLKSHLFKHSYEELLP